MPFVMSVSPDFPPNHIAGWFIFNTWLQNELGIPIHLELYDSFTEQRNAIVNDEIDLIYANPYDATMLVREKNFTAIVTPANKTDEAIIATSKSSKITQIEQLQEGIRIARTDDPDVNMMGMIMIEPADLDNTNTTTQTVDSYPLIAKQLIQGNADIGFFLDEAYDTLSNLTKRELNILIRSEIFVIRHVLLAGSRLKDKIKPLTEAMLGMNQTEKGKGILESMAMDGWETQTQEDTEFMIDLMDTLIS